MLNTRLMQTDQKTLCSLSLYSKTNKVATLQVEQYSLQVNDSDQCLPGSRTLWEVVAAVQWLLKASNLIGTESCFSKQVEGQHIRPWRGPIWRRCRGEMQSEQHERGDLFWIVHLLLGLLMSFLWDDIKSGGDPSRLYWEMFTRCTMRFEFSMVFIPDAHITSKFGLFKVYLKVWSKGEAYFQQHFEPQTAKQNVCKL